MTVTISYLTDMYETNRQHLKQARVNTFVFNEAKAETLKLSGTTRLHHSFTPDSNNMSHMDSSSPLLTLSMFLFSNGKSNDTQTHYSTAPPTDKPARQSTGRTNSYACTRTTRENKAT